MVVTRRRTWTGSPSLTPLVVGHPGGRGLPGGLGFLADGAALGGALGVEHPLGFLACPDGAAVAADAGAGTRGLLADEVADALLGHDQSFLPEPGERQPDGHQARLIGLRERRQTGSLDPGGYWPEAIPARIASAIRNCNDLPSVLSLTTLNPIHCWSVYTLRSAMLRVDSENRPTEAKMGVSLSRTPPGREFP